MERIGGVYLNIRKVHCLFEQSGTFKNEFKSLGIDAEDYDIKNEFGETDHNVDIFAEIEKAYNHEESIFDNIGDCDLIFAFFPCTRFEAQIQMAFRGERPNERGWSDEKKIEQSMRLHEELHRLYMLICKLFTVCLRGGWRMIVENPYNQHYLTTYFPIKPSLIDNDRSKNGDYYRKPTQYWFINCKPENNIVFTPLDFVKQRKITHREPGQETQRSMIHRQYAERFIKSYVLDAEGGVWTA